MTTATLGFMEPTLTRATRGVVVLGGRGARLRRRLAPRPVVWGKGKGAAFSAAPPSRWKPPGTRLLAAGAASEVYGWHTWPPSVPVQMPALHGPMQLVVKQLVVAELQPPQYRFVLVLAGYGGLV